MAVKPWKVENNVENTIEKNGICVFFLSIVVI